ncbi:DUF4136 domain-containing protein [Dyadobacter endophyticus]|uniref:DUF4136 domain-containing protein n=1 Tax=Dyadobacter endophyticus TaxID=1749036 RepID=UPI003CED75DB
MRNLPALVFLCSIFLITACSSSYKLLKVKKENTFKLADYATYGFYDIEATGDTVSKNFEKNVNIIREAIAKNLQSRGLDEARDPGLKINIALNVREQLQTRQTDFRTDGLPRYMGQRRYSWKSEEVVTGKYREGTIVIDLVDAANNRMVWQGGASGIIPEKTKNFTEDINRVIGEVVAKIP